MSSSPSHASKLAAETSRHALVVEDSQAINALLRAELMELAGVASEGAATLEQTKALLAERPERFFIAVLDLNLPDAADGEVVDYVSQFDIPIIVLTGNLDTSARQRMRQDHLVDYVLKRNASEIDYVCNLVRQIRDNYRRKVLVVDDSRSFRLYLRGLLSVHKYQLLEAANGKQALQQLKANPDTVLVISDYNMPGMDGAELIEIIRRDHRREELAIIGISDRTKAQVSARLLKAGANDFITKPFEVEEFYCRVMQSVDMIARVCQIRNAARRDFLTGVYNRSYLYEQGEEMYARAKKSAAGLAVAMVDADHFKRINDRYGHQAGDAALVAIANSLQQSLGEACVVGRYGGEEFVCLLPGASESLAMQQFERVRAGIEALSIQNGGDSFQVTVSIGVTLDPGESLEQMITRADQGLYQAKAAGRNRVELN
jgi:diguanylate cyclase (GGDEF)-like protein